MGKNTLRFKNKLMKQKTKLEDRQHQKSPFFEKSNELTRLMTKNEIAQINNIKDTKGFIITNHKKSDIRKNDKLCR